MLKTKVLFVCLGNICRSPMAEGTFRNAVEKAGLSDQFEIDSAGTSGWHIGEPPDGRTTQTAITRGIDLSAQRSRKVRQSDFEDYDYIIAMDRDNFGSLMGTSSKGSQDRIRMFLEFAPKLSETEVPDPYFGGQHGFDHVLDLVEEASDGLLAHIMQDRNKHG